MGRGREPTPSAAAIGDLRQRIAAIERGHVPGFAGGAPVVLGLAAVDAVLPGGGLARGVVHEVAAVNRGGQEGPAAAGFVAWLAARCAAPMAAPGAADDGGGGAAARPVLWCQGRTAAQETGALYGPGLAAFGHDAARLVMVSVRRDADILWAMEEGLRCAGLSAVVGEVERIGLTASRRLQLAAVASGVAALLLRPDHRRLGASAAVTRWQVAAAPGPIRSGRGGPPADLGEELGAQLGPGRWDVDLWRCRGGRPGRWLLEWNDETGAVAVAAPLADRPDEVGGKVAGGYRRTAD